MPISHLLLLAVLSLTGAQPDAPRIVVSIGGDLVAITADGTRDATLVANGCNNSARWTDGARLIFHANCGSYGLYALDLVSGEITFLIPADGVVSPDGTLLAELRRDPSGHRWPNAGTYRIAVWEIASGESREVASGSHDYVPGVHVGWSRDGRFVAFETRFGPPETVVVDLASGAVNTLIEDILAFNTPPSGRADTVFEWAGASDRLTWSSDGRFAAYASYTSYHEALHINMYGVTIYDAETTDRRAVHPSTENGIMPAWSRDGRLAYISNTANIIPYTLGSGQVVQRPVSFEYHLHVVNGEENRIVLTRSETMSWPLWLP